MWQNFYKISIKIAVGALFALAFFLRCANQAPPQGGRRDSLPPRVVGMNPRFAATNFNAKRVYIEFDEYVQLKDQMKEFFTSPFMGVQPVLSIRGRGIQIDIRDTLRPNQTYSFNFGKSVADNNEGNVLSDFRYVFSTGSSVDSLLMSGYAVDAYTRDSVNKCYILFYPAEWDSVPKHDSLMFHPPVAVARAHSNGIFLAENLKPIDYRVYVLDDRNGNRRYEPGVDRVAFLDGVYNPAKMEPFTIRYDTTRKYNVPDPQLYFRVFTDAAFKRQYLSGKTRDWQHRIVLSFAATEPVVSKLRWDNIDSTKVIRQYLKPTHDSIAYWLNIPSAELPDTVKGEITYLKHDSLGVLRPVTEKLILGWKSFAPKKQNKADTLKVNPFKYNVSASALLNPYNNIPISFDYPLTQLDSAAVTLTRIESVDKRYKTKFRFEQDSVDMRKWTLKAQWTPDAKYELMIPAGAFVNVAGQKNDTLKATFSIIPPEKFGSIELNVIGRTPESEYVLQLTDPAGKLMREIRHARQGEYTLPNIEPGKVRIRIIEDMNGNGIWDSGDLVKRMQPERAELFIDKSGEPDINIKENWALAFDLDMTQIFVPVTMERIVDQLQKMEFARIQKLLKQRAEDIKRKPRGDNPSNSGSSGSGFGGMGGMGGGVPMPTGIISR